jgi:hypothetical protein
MKKVYSRKNTAVDLMDKTSGHCQNIVVLAELLAGCEAESLNPQAITHASDLIFRESLKLHESLEALYRRLPKSK